MAQEELVLALQEESLVRLGHDLLYQVLADILLVLEALRVDVPVIEAIIEAAVLVDEFPVVVPVRIDLLSDLYGLHDSKVLDLLEDDLIYIAICLLLLIWLRGGEFFFADKF